MSFHAHCRYKPTCASWIKLIPDHWDMYQARRLFAQRREDVRAGDEQLSATQRYGVIPQKLFMEQEDQKVVLALSGTGSFRHVEENDFVISLRSFQGGIERSRYSGCVSPAYTVLQPRADLVAGFWEYLLKSAPYISALQTTTDGIREGKSISYQQFGTLHIPLPPLDEQRTIAAFLDHETAKIDTLVEEQRRLIELLKEKRQAVISQAVTKGLDPSVPMQDSGKKWIGRVPMHWTLMRLKHATAHGKNAFVDGPFGSNLKSEHFVDDGDVYVIESGFATQGILETGDLKTISAEHFATINRSETRGGDIIIAKIGAQFGKSSILPVLDKPAVVSGNSLKLTVNAKAFDVNFVNWHLVNLKAIGVMDDIVNATAQPALSLGEMNNLPLVGPPVEEQQAIVAYLVSRLGDLDGLMREAKRGIELLLERRSALISAAVTGKIDVRGLVPQPESDAA